MYPKLSYFTITIHWCYISNIHFMIACILTICFKYIGFQTLHFSINWFMESELVVNAQTRAVPFMHLLLIFMHSLNWGQFTIKSFICSNGQFPFGISQEYYYCKYVCIIQEFSLCEHFLNVNVNLSYWLYHLLAR